MKMLNSKYYQNFNYREIASISILLIMIVATSNMGFAKSTFSSERIENAVQSIITKKIGSESEIEFLTIPKTQEFSQDDVSAEIILDDVINPGTNIVGIRFSDDSKILKYIEISVRVKLFSEVWVTNRTVPSNTKLTQNDFVKKSKPINSNNLPLDISELIGRELIRTTSIGEYVTKEMLTSEILIKRGDKVTLVVQSGGVRVRCAGTATQDGAEGQSIRVKRDGSPAVLTGKVTEDGIVLVNYGNLTLN